MDFQILSHAGLAINNNGTQLICDPWVIGSCYWRSWWNYPPVAKELVESLRPDFIYLTHIHWDHFQGPSLRKLGLNTTIIIPKAPGKRLKQDLVDMGCSNIIEAEHGKRMKLADDFYITSYHFWMFLDSAIVIETDGVTLFNANDAKFMGLPYKQILNNHPKIDFVFRSHSSANSRLCYEILDQENIEVDNIEDYIDNFVAFVQASGAKYAIPFASNHCHLHKDVCHLNHLIQTPQMVDNYFRENNISSPEIKVMVSGDSWSNENGFKINKDNWFDDRETKIEKYRDQVAEKLELQYQKEEKSKVNKDQLKEYFSRYLKDIPKFLRAKFKNDPITYILKSGLEQKYYEINIYSGKIRELSEINDSLQKIQIHMNAFLMLHCIKKDLFSHLAISKRVKFKVSHKKLKLLKTYNFIFNMYEYNLFPLHRVFTYRFINCWARRWREIILYIKIAHKLLLKKKNFSYIEHLNFNDNQVK